MHHRSLAGVVLAGALLGIPAAGHAAGVNSYKVSVEFDGTHATADETIAAGRCDESKRSINQTDDVLGTMAMDPFEPGLFAYPKESSKLKDVQVTKDDGAGCDDNGKPVSGTCTNTYKSSKSSFTGASIVLRRTDLGFKVTLNMPQFAAALETSCSPKDPAASFVGQPIASLPNTLTGRMSEDRVAAGKSFTTTVLGRAADERVYKRSQCGSIDNDAIQCDTDLRLKATIHFKAK